MKARHTIVLGAVAVGLLAAAGSARAGVAVVSRETTIRAAVLDDTAAVLESTDGTTGLGAFDNAVSRSFDFDPNDPFGGGSQAEASQRSSLSFLAGNLTGAQVSGEASGINALEALGTFKLVFDVVDEPVTFLLSPAALAGGEGGTPGSGELTLTDLTRNQVLRFEQSGDTGLPSEPEPSDPFDPDGVLQPGRYELDVQYGVRNNFGFGRADVGIAFAPVPLPPAVWPGLAAILGGCAWTCRRTRACRA